jgi:hypothetical protein
MVKEKETKRRSGIAQQIASTFGVIDICGGIYESISSSGHLWRNLF